MAYCLSTLAPRPRLSDLFCAMHKRPGQYDYVSSIDGRRQALESQKRFSGNEVVRASPTLIVASPLAEAFSLTISTQSLRLPYL